MVKKNNNVWYLIGGVVIFILIITVIVFQAQNRQKQADLERELQRIQEEREFCDSLKISIGDGAIPYGSPVGVNYAFCSNKDTTAKSIITLKNGLITEEDERLQEGSCMLQQIQYWAGYTGSGYQGEVICKDIASIELISKRCPQVKDIITNMDEITCGI